MGIRFGIDIDGTVTSPEALLPFINKDFQLNLTLNDITQYELTPFVNVSKEEFSKWFMENEPIIYDQSLIADGAKEVLNKWKQEHHLLFITARAKRMEEITKNWFHRHEIEYDDIILLGSHHKVEAAKELKVDIFLEDKHDNAVSIHEECGIPVLLFDTPYNRLPIPDGVIRVHSWKEVDQFVDEWLKTKEK